MILTTKIYFWFRSYILIIRRKNQSDELLKYLQSGSTLYFEAIKNPLVKQSSRGRVDLWLQSWFPKSSFISNFLHFQIRPHWKMFHDSEHCFYFLNASLLLFFDKNCGDIWLKIAWQILLKGTNLLLQIFLKLIFELAWKVIHHVNCIKSISH